MKSGDFYYCKSLSLFNYDIQKMLEEAHGFDYTLNHVELTNLMSIGFHESRSKLVIKELGVNQGSSLSSILLHPYAFHVIGIDNVPERFEPYKRLFETHAKENNKNFTFLGCSSLDQKAIDIECDILHIDSLHEYDHLKKELWAHGPNTNHYILVHDTTLYPKQVKAIEEFVKAFPEWSIWKVNKQNVGYHVLKKETK